MMNMMLIINSDDANDGYIYDNDEKGWDPKFLIRANGLQEKLVISFGFVFSNLGLKSQNLQIHPKKYFFYSNVSLFHICC